MLHELVPAAGRRDHAAWDTLFGHLFNISDSDLRAIITGVSSRRVLYLTLTPSSPASGLPHLLGSRFLICSLPL